MSRQQAFQPATTGAQQPHSRTHRAYTIRQVCDALELNRRTFFHPRKAGQLPMLEELRPRLGRTVRYRADLIDRYLAGDWQAVSRSHGRQSRVGQTTTVSPISGQKGS